MAHMVVRETEREKGKCRHITQRHTQNVKTSYNGIVSFIVKVLPTYDIKATQSLNHLETEHLDGYHDLLAMVTAD